MSSLSDKFSNFSIYDVKKAARKAQNSLFASNSPIELMIRKATTTDSWGPSTKQLDEILQQLHYENPEVVFDVIFTRIIEYLGPSAHSSIRYKKQSYYNRAVHYVNSGNEWRIISKNLKIVEYLILHSQQEDEYIGYVEEHRGALKKVLECYEYGANVPDANNVTTAELDKKEHAKVVTKSVNEIIKLLDDEEYRSAQCLKASRVSNLGSVRNDTVVFPNKVDQVSGFKTKHMNSSKVQNSNVKDEIKNQVGHVIHTKKRLPGRYANFGEVENNDLYDDSGFGEFHEDESYNDYYSGASNSKGFKDEDEEDSGKKADLYDPVQDNDDSEDEEFGDFQTESSSPMASKSKPHHEQELLSFDDNLPEPYTPTTTATGTFDSFFTALNSPVSSKPTPTTSINPTSPSSSKPKTDTFADLFNNAKTSN